MSARYVLRGLLGVTLGAAVVVIAALEIYHLVRTGSCASGGPYVSARPCPAGTGGRIFVLIAAIFLLGPLSVWAFASRAKGVGGVAGGAGLVGLLWTFGWIAMGSAAWVAGHGPARTPGSGDGGTAVAITFWGIGGLSLLGGLLLVRGAQAGERRMMRAGGARPATATTPPPPPRPTTVTPGAAGVQQLATALNAVAAKREDAAETGDIARRLKQLDELKAMGAVTGAEYDAKRREILGEI